MAPYMKQQSIKATKLFAILTYLTIFIWPIFDFICNCLECDSNESIQKEQNDESSLLFGAIGEEMEFCIPTSSSCQIIHLEDLGKKFNEFKALKKSIHGEIERIEAELEGVLAGKVFGKGNLVEQEFRINEIPGIQNEFKRPKEEQDTDFKKESEKVKKAVENCVNADHKIQRSKQMESNQEIAGNITQDPKMSQCSGGNGNSSGSKNQPTARESNEQQGMEGTSNAAEGCRNSDGGFGGDGGDDNDPHKRNPELPKGHYHDYPVPQNNQDGLPDGSSHNVQPELLPKNPIPCSESNESTSVENGSNSVESLINYVSLSDEQQVSGNDNEHGEANSDTENINDSGSETPIEPLVEPGYRGYTPIFNPNKEQKIIYPFQDGLDICDLYMNPDPIGRGSFGRCYEILDIRLQRTLALKKIKLKDFEQDEIEIWSVLSEKSCNVVQLLGAFEDGEDVYIFMELMSGTFKYIADNHVQLNLTERRVAALMKPVLKFLECVHSNGYIYGDTKPENTFFGDNNIKIGDFGLARARGRGEKSLTSKYSGLRGTVAYMPKELFCGGEHGPSSDIYEAAGMIIYLLTGDPPWASAEPFTVIFKVGSGETPAIPDDCSEQMKRLLEHMLNTDHTKRPTAKELLQFDPIFFDTAESRLDDVLEELLVDIQLLRRHSVPRQPLVDMNDFLVPPVAVGLNQDQVMELLFDGEDADHCSSL